jgi:predicted phage tail protein
MVNIKLHGIFEKYIKTDWKLNVKTVLEAFRAIEANTNRFVNSLISISDISSHFLIYVDDKLIAREYLNSPILKKNSKIEVVPVISGSGPVSIITAIIVILISTAVSYLVTKLLTPKAPQDRKNVSSLFSGYENVVSRGVAIPFGYGRLRLGSIVIGNDVIFQYGATDNNKYNLSTVY